jgi:hypothetical protein
MVNYRFGATTLAFKFLKMVNRFDATTFPLKILKMVDIFVSKHVKRCHYFFESIEITKPSHITQYLLLVILWTKQVNN